MRLQLSTIICVCISLIVVISLAVIMKVNEQGVNREAVNLESEEFKMMREHAQSAYQAQNYTQAIQLYEDSARMRPENAEVHNDLGATYYDFGLAHAGPDWPSWGEKDLSDSPLTAALQELQTAIKQVGSGYIVLKTDDPEVTAAIEKKVGETDGYVYTERFENNATINILIGKTKAFFMKARNSYLVSIDIKPTYSPAYRNLGSLYMKIGQHDAAIDYFEKAYQLDPRDKELEQYLSQFK